MSVHVQRDPFARGEYHRFSKPDGICQWDGQKRRVVYAYVWEEDQKNECPPRYPGQLTYFCNFECHKVYNGF